MQRMVLKGTWFGYWVLSDLWEHALLEKVVHLGENGDTFATFWVELGQHSKRNEHWVLGQGIGRTRDGLGRSGTCLLVRHDPSSAR
jgi:hypothetical protein